MLVRLDNNILDISNLEIIRLQDTTSSDNVYLSLLFKDHTSYSFYYADKKLAQCHFEFLWSQIKKSNYNHVEYEEKAAKPKEAPEWISVHTAMPSQDCKCYIQCEDGYQYAVVYDSDIEKFKTRFSDGDDDYFINVTHWRPRC
jgi:hypothetical protein